MELELSRLRSARGASTTRSRWSASAPAATASRSTSTVDPTTRRFDADERKVKQILLNLLSNAVKFTPEGGKVEVVAAPGRQTASRSSVSDTGIGIAPEDQRSDVRGVPSGRQRLHQASARAPDWASRWPAASSSCTAARSGCRASRAKVRRFTFTLPSPGIRDHGKRTDPDRRRQRQEPQAGARYA